jgi:hypothetical protein
MAALVLLSTTAGSQAQENVVISEFMAVNNSIRADADGDFEDWIEVQNAGSTPVNLAGWHLTDDATRPTRWRFPAVALNPGGKVLVFASDKNRNNAGAELHTNFKLSGGGEYLALIKPDGTTVAHDYAPAYPPQIGNVSYGLGMNPGSLNLVAANAQMKYRVPASNADEATWFTAAYDDAAWTPANFGAGYASQPTDIYYSTPGLINPNADLLSMWTTRSSVWFRTTFTVTDPGQIQSLTLRMKFDDGFAAYLNGQRIAGELVDTAVPLPWNATTTAGATVPTDAQSMAFKDFLSTTAPSFLLAGTNVLAIHGVNRIANDSDLLFVPELNAVTVPQLTGSTVYFSTPTPGSDNGPGAATLGPIVADLPQTLPPQPRLGGQVTIPVTARVVPTFSDVASVNLKWRVMFNAEQTTPMNDGGTGGDAVAGDGLWTGTLVTPASPVIAPGQMIRWRVEATDTAARLTKEPPYTSTTNSPEYYGTIAEDTSVSTSLLPVLHWFMEGTQNPDAESRARIALYYNGEFFDNVGANLHGQSTGGFPKKSYDLYFNSGFDFEWRPGQPRINSLNLLSNWADKAKVRNTLAYELISLCGVKGHFAQPVRVQRNGTFFATADMVEDGDEDYLKRAGLDPMGALYKMYSQFQSGVALSYEKKTREFEGATDITAFYNGMIQTGDAKLVFGYDNVDVPATVNFLAANSMVHNNDLGHKNYYLFRDSTGSLLWRILPWDNDLAFGHNWVSGPGYFDDTIYTANPVNPGPGSSNAVFNFGYAGDARLQEMFRRRLRTLADRFLKSSGTDSWHHTRVAELLAQIDPPGVTSDADLDFTRWGSWGNNDNMQTACARILSSNGANPAYVPGRRAFLYSTTFPAGWPASQPEAPAVNFGPLQANPGGTDSQEREYFTVENPNAFAVDLSGWTVSGGVEFTFEPGTVLPAFSAADAERGRLYVARTWPGFRTRTGSPRTGEKKMVVAGYDEQLSARGETLTLKNEAGTVIATLTYPAAPLPAQVSLRISEIHFAPSPPTPAELAANPAWLDSDFEFIELLNTGAAPLDLAGAKFTEGVDFTFPAGATLAAGARVLIVANTAAFAARHGGGFNIAGQYTGRLSNAGETLHLVDVTGESILEFAYNDVWYPATETLGLSLVVLDPLTTPYNEWDKKTRWGVSLQQGGTPGAATNGTAMLFEVWQLGEFTAVERDDDLISGPLANPNDDSLNNLLAYAFAGRARSGCEQNYPTATTVTNAGETYPALTFRRPKDALDLTWQLESSGDSSTWSPADSVIVSTTGHGDGTETLTLRAALPYSSENRLLLRLAVGKPY